MSLLSADQDRVNENRRLVAWSDEFYQVSRYGAKNRANSRIRFLTLFKDQVLEYKLTDILLRYGYFPLGKVKILDMGCGEGRFLRKFIDWGANPVNLSGIDINEGIIELARDLCAPGIDFTIGGGDCMPYADQSFDIIINVGVLQCIMNNDLFGAVAQECMRVLRDDGIMITCNITENALPKFFAAALVDHMRGVGKNDLETMFQGCAVNFENFPLNDMVTNEQVKQQWGSLFDMALHTDVMECDYGIAVITKPSR